MSNSQKKSQKSIGRLSLGRRDYSADGYKHLHPVRVTWFEQRRSTEAQRHTLRFWTPALWGLVDPMCSVMDRSCSRAGQVSLGPVPTTLARRDSARITRGGYMSRNCATRSSQPVPAAERPVEAAGYHDHQNGGHHEAPCRVRTRV